MHENIRNRAGEVVTVHKFYESGHLDVRSFDLKSFAKLPLEAFKQTSNKFLKEHTSHRSCSAKPFFQKNLAK